MNNCELLVYTRKPDKIYTHSLSGSVHFACRSHNGEFTPLNNNYGILFPEATISMQNTICEKNLKNPYIFYDSNGLFGIIAVRTCADGIDDEESRGQILYWTSPDLINFDYHGLICLQDIACAEVAVCRYDEIIAPGINNINLSDINPGNIIQIKPDVYQAVCNYWSPPKQVKPPAAPSYTFPLARGYADPVILLKDDKYYFIATNDNKDDIGLYAREADTIEGLFAEGYTETVILDVDEEKGFIQTFWAPEFHYIGGELYILFAVGGKQWAPQCYIMKHKRSGNITNPNDWETPVRVRRSDGSYLTEDGITLDMTYFTAEGRSYVVWSYRYGIGTASDTGSMLYIAEINDKDPSILISDPVLISRPLLGWENLQGTVNNEGPYPLITDDMVYITYSGGAARGYTYSIGVLSIPRGSDYLDASNWKKSITPVVNYLTIDGLYGAGHNSFFTDREGNLMMAYHAEEEIITHGQACCGMHKVYFRQDKTPVFYTHK